MKKTAGLLENRGSALVLAIGVMAFLGIIMHGILPMITQEVRSGAMSRDVLEARYAAEAGAKRAIAAMETADALSNWNWILSGSTVLFAGSSENKTYKVTLRASTPMTFPGIGIPQDGTFWLKSEGTVNSVTKTLYVDASKGAPVVFTQPGDAALYARTANVSFGTGNRVYNSSIGAGGNITGTPTMSSGYAKYTGLSLTLPTINIASHSSSPAPPTTGGNLSGEYYASQDWSITNGSSYTGSGTIYVVRDTVLPRTVSFNGSFLIVAGRNINGNSSRASTFNGVIFFAANNVTFTDTTGGNNITGTAIAGNAIQIGRNDTFTYSAALLAAFPVIPSSGAYSSKNWIFQ